MAVNILTKKEILKNRKESGYSESASRFMNDMKTVVPGSERKISIGDNLNWNESNEKYNELWANIKEAQEKAQVLYNSGETALFKNHVGGASTPTDIYTFIDLLQIDITRRIVGGTLDLTDRIANIITDENFDETIKLNEFLPYSVWMNEIRGHGESVNLLEQKTGAQGTVSFKLWGMGDVEDLHSVLFNKLSSIERKNTAYAKAVAGRRNLNNICRYISHTYAAGQLEPANADSGASLEQKRYRTINSAIKRLQGLIDPQTGEPIEFDKATLLFNSQDIDDYVAILNGKLEKSDVPEILGVGNDTRFSRLGDVIEFNTHTIPYNNRTYTVPGVTVGEAILLVPLIGYSFRKRNLTSQTGPGDVLTLAQNATAWYIVESEFYTDALLLAVKITLP